MTVLDNFFMIEFCCSGLKTAFCNGPFCVNSMFRRPEGEKPLAQVVEDHEQP